MPYLLQSIAYEIQGVRQVIMRSFAQRDSEDLHLHSETNLARDSLSYIRAFVQNLQNYETKDSQIWENQNYQSNSKSEKNTLETTDLREKNLFIESDFAMIYSLTPRSKLYLEILKNGGMLPAHLIVLGGNQEEQREMQSQLQALRVYAQNLALDIQILSTKDINDPRVFKAIKALPQSYVIYSGYGGGILRRQYFELPKHFIHIHAGKLPDYRGSTTCYYSLLEQSEICATAMFLNQKLDCGDVLGSFVLDIEAIRALKNTDIDTSIEPYIRAQALLRTFQDYRENKAFSPTIQTNEQENKRGETYYRIHPTLKHLALFLCFGSRDKGGNT